MLSQQYQDYTKDHLAFHQAIIKDDDKLLSHLMEKGLFIGEDEIEQIERSEAHKCKTVYKQQVDLLVQLTDPFIDKANKYRKIRDFIAINLNSRDIMNILQLCVLSGNVEILKYFLQKTGINPNLQDYLFENTALIYAVEKNDLASITALLNHPCIDPNIVNIYGQTALSIAITKGYFQAFQLLIQHPKTPKINKSDIQILLSFFLISAVNNQDIQTVETLITLKDLDINFPYPYGNTPLMYAVHIGNKNIVDILLQHPDLDVNRRNNDGQTALLLAAKLLDLTIFQKLLKHNAQYYIADNQGYTLFDYANRNYPQNMPFINQILQEHIDSINTAEWRNKQNNHHTMAPPLTGL